MMILSEGDLDGRWAAGTCNDEFCIKNHGIRIKNDGFCVTNDEFCIQNAELCIKIQVDPRGRVAFYVHLTGVVKHLKQIGVIYNKTDDFILKMMNFVLKLMNLQPGTDGRR